LAEFFIHFDIDNVPEMEGTNTVAGLILQELNHIPRTGEKVLWRHLELEVIDMDNVKIDKVLVRKVVK
jgi:putative hemolysin